MNARNFGIPTTLGARRQRVLDPLPRWEARRLIEVPCMRLNHKQSCLHSGQQVESSRGAYRVFTSFGWALERDHLAQVKAELRLHRSSLWSSHRTRMLSNVECPRRVCNLSRFFLSLVFFFPLFIKRKYSFICQNIHAVDSPQKNFKFKCVGNFVSSNSSSVDGHFAA